MSDKKILVGDMSRETAIGILKLMLEAMEVYDSIVPTPQRRNAVQMAISSLETDEAYQLEYEQPEISKGLFEQIKWERDIAIEQLKELGYEFGEKIEPTTKNDLGVDAISRDEVCRYVAEFVNHEFSTREEEELIDNIITGIEHMPSVTPQEPRWISVSERLPENGQNVLFCDIDNDIMVGYHIKGRPNTHFSQDGTYEDMKNVRAWMPLPTPYEPQESEG